MARVSRKMKSLEIVHHKYRWQTASYARLSIEDNGQETDESIRNQENLIEEFVNQNPELQVIDRYIDNGNTGTNFARPDWERLMNDVKKEKIRCIIVKDLSRLGRNYIEAGNLIEKVFPFLGVRFIAINDRYDSEKTLFKERELEISLKNLINDFYSKDISKKVRSAFESKKRNGEYIGSCAPYGYILKRNHLYPDDNTRDVVRRIFYLKLEGYSDYSIANIFNRENIPSPSRYKGERGDEKYRKFTDSLWQPQAVKRIINDEVYIGNTIHRYDKSIYSMRKEKLPKEDWFRCEDTHEGLIDKAIFLQLEERQKESIRKRQIQIAKERPRYDNVLQGILKCGICGKSIRRNKVIREVQGQEKASYYLFCASKYSYEKVDCNASSIKDSKIYEVIYKQIMIQVDLAIELESLVKTIGGQSLYQEEQKAIEKKLIEVNQMMKRYSQSKIDIYEELKENNKTMEEYLQLKMKFTNKIGELAKRQDALIQKKRRILESGIESNRWISAFTELKESKQLTREMALALLDEVKMYGTDRIEIVYKYKDEYEEVLEYLKRERKAYVE